MSNVKWEFQKWFDDLFHFYQVVKSGDKKAQTEVWFNHK